VEDQLSGNKEEEGKRLAIIIGINKYEDDGEVPDLFGSENDAIALHNRLTTLGEFEVLPNHLLLGKNATYKAILKAVSDIFRHATDCSLVIFYFSGHGLIDETNEGYIAPYGMYSADHYVCGINMEDLRKVIYRSQNKASVVVILDCCYAGIATKNTKSVSDLQTKVVYESNLKKLTEPPDTDKLVSSGRGKIILASSEANAPSREKQNCKHYNENDTPHTHGTFTFHLLKGLDGKAADADTGIINFETLRKYVEDQLNTEGKQKPISSINEAFRTENIILAKSLDLFNNKIAEVIVEADDLCKNDDIQSLAQASKIVLELTALDYKNNDIPRLIEIINNAASKYRSPLVDWLSDYKYSRRVI
jgi:uncharacterized caspase-like protein